MLKCGGLILDEYFPLLFEVCFFTSCLYYKHIRIVNDDSRVIRVMLQVVASPTIIIENIYSIGITHDNGNMFIVQAWLNEVGQT